jgi:hypothetical protein
MTTDEYGISLAGLRAAEDVDRLESTFRMLRGAHRSRACDDCTCTQVCGKFVEAS